MPPKVTKFSEILKKFQDLARKTYKPVIGDSTENQSLLESKFGGKPFVSEQKYPWPLCIACGDKQKFFLQLNSDTMPANLKVKENYFDGLLQMFYCIECSNYMPFSESQNLRIVENFDLVNSLQITDASKNEDEFPFKRISGWAEDTDFVHKEEFVEIYKEYQTDYDELNDISENNKTKAGEKFLGWPDWVQGVEYPDCRICKNKMRFLFQVDSEYNIPFMWGDVGCGHIFQCEQHKDEITFTWACH